MKSWTLPVLLSFCILFAAGQDRQAPLPDKASIFDRYVRQALALWKTQGMSIVAVKDGRVVFLYTPDAAKQDAYIQNAQKRSYDVLLMNSPIDNHFISHLEQHLDKTSLKRVDSDVMDKLIQKDEAIETVLSDAR